MNKYLVTIISILMFFAFIYGVQALTEQEAQAEFEALARRDAFSPISQAAPAEEAPLADSTDFSDLAGYEWALEAVHVLARQGILNGRGRGVFDPGGEVTRAEFAKMLALSLGVYKPSAVSDFQDAEGHWAQSYIASLFGAAAFGAAEFRPDEALTREDMAYFALVALGEDFPPDTLSSERFSDYMDLDEVSDYARAGVAAAIDFNIMRGSGDGLFRPKATTTRAETAKTLLMFKQTFAEARHG
jgi:hypothetical protein